MNPRPSRSQQNLLEFIDSFVTAHGYGPSYREIMRALDYKSISTVAVHINGLVAKGQLKKYGRSARSLEVVKENQEKNTNSSINGHEKWLIEQIDAYAGSKNADQTKLSAIADACEALGLQKAAAKAKASLEK